MQFFLNSQYHIKWSIFQIFFNEQNTSLSSCCLLKTDMFTEDGEITFTLLNFFVWLLQRSVVINVSITIFKILEENR